MKKSLLNFRTLTVALVVLLTSTLVSAQTRTASVTGNWNNTATWGGASVPTSANDVVINSGITVTVNVAAACNSVTFTAGASGATLAIGANSLAVTGAVVMNGTTAGSGTLPTLMTITTGSVSCASLALNPIAGNLNSSNRRTEVTITTGSLTVSGNISASGNVVGAGGGTGITFSGAGTLDVGGNFYTSPNIGEFTQSTSTVNYSGAAQSILAHAYNNLTFSGSGIKTIPAATTVNGTLSIQGAATVAGTSPTYGGAAILEYNGNTAQTTSNVEFPAAFAADLIVDNAAGVTLNGAKTVNGSITLTSGTLAAGNNLSMSTTGTPLITVTGGSLTGNLQGAADYNVTYTGSSKTTGGELSGSGLATVTVNVTAGQTVTLDQTRTPDGNLTVTAGILDLSTFTMNRSAAGGTLTVSNGATLKIGSTNSIPSNYNAHAIGSTSPFSTIEYAGTAQSVATFNSGQSYGNLILSGSGVKTFTGETVNGTLSIQGTATTAGTSPVYATAAVLEYAGSGVQTTSAVEFIANLRNLKINNSNGVDLHAARTVLISLNLTSGNLNTTATNLLNLADGATTSNASDNSFVNGPLSKTGNDAFTFPVGVAGAGMRTIAISAPGNIASVFTAEFKRSSAHGLGGITAPITQVSGCEYWTLANTGTASAASVILSWSPNSPCNGAYVGNLSTLLVGRLSGGNWVSEGRLSTTGSASAGTITTLIAVTAVNITSSYALATSAADNALPVMFADVKAYQKNSGVQLEWSNLTERDLTGYTVERSSNGQNFTAIAQQAPRSNRNDKESYTAFDAAPFSGINFYRIKVVEVSGKVIYSKILKVDISGNLGGFSLYPNPVSGSQVSVSLSVKQGQYTVKVVNSAGQEVLSKRLTQQGGSMTQTIDLPSSIKPGLYNMVITGDNYRESKMFVVQ